jgi:chromosome segregation ATPase
MCGRPRSGKSVVWRIGNCLKPCYKLQMALEEAGDGHAAAAASRAEADAELAALSQQAAAEEAALKERNAQLEGLQKELDRLAASLRAVQVLAALRWALYMEGLHPVTSETTPWA